MKNVRRWALPLIILLIIILIAFGIRDTSFITSTQNCGKLSGKAQIECCQSAVGKGAVWFNPATKSCEFILPDSCDLNHECPLGFICYNSQLCSPSPQGSIVCSEQYGDLKCHKECATDADCSSTTPHCEVKEMFQGDVRTDIKICS